MFVAAGERWVAQGLPATLAQALAGLPDLAMALDVVEVASSSQHDVEEVAAVFYQMGAALELDWLRERIEELPVESRWHAQARGSLRDELAAQHRTLAMQVIAAARKGDATPVQTWLGRDDAQLRYTLGMLAEIRGQSMDYPIASVALRRLAQLAHAS